MKAFFTQPPQISQKLPRCRFANGFQSPYFMRLLNGYCKAISVKIRSKKRKKKTNFAMISVKNSLFFAIFSVILQRLYSDSLKHCSNRLKGA